MSTEAGELQKRFEERDKKLSQHRRTVQKTYYESAQAIKGRGIPVAYATGMVPPEIFYAMGVQPYFPENYCAVCCARQMAEKFCETAEAGGISRDTCSYSRVALGMMLRDDGPFGALPKPDFILTTSVTCDPHAKWFEFYSDYFHVPLLSLDNPFLFHEPEPQDLEWVATNIKEIFASIEEITGNKFDYDRFQEVMSRAIQARELFGEIHQYRKAIPCPRGLREVVGDLFYMLAMVGTPEAVEYLTMVRDDVKERVENKVGVVREEKFRLIWDNIPVWYNLKLFDYFTEHGAVFAIDSYPAATWGGLQFEGGHLDPEKPLESLALVQLHQDPYMSLERQMQRFERMAREWHCDGAVFFSNRNCQILSKAVPEKERLFRERTGGLSMSFEAEMADPRSLYEVEVKRRIDSFLESLGQRKGGGQ